MSGRGGVDDEAAARAAGMDACLRKPVAPQALAEALAAIRRQPSR
jgi:CheY-like chemotaxis protein